ncbi:hypothetical protein B0H14DRAFT_3000120 [Mycena olivaceomarginata]|nr:hypothetical protein B0H14DRAFT_3000120 [Mycena olivaceomarginata]
MSSGSRGDSEKPERSRNAKAQARHRAKRKAYIEELEETVTKLQSALGQFNLEHTMSVLPPPLAKIRELEQENARLLKQNDELHRLLADAGRRPPAAPPEREYKRRKMDNGHGEEMYISRPGSSHDALLARPPPLTVPDAPALPLSHPHGHYHDNVPTHHTSTAAAYPASLSGPPAPSGLHLPDSSADAYDAVRDREAPAYPVRPVGDPDAQQQHHGHPDAHYTLPPFKFSAAPQQQQQPEHDSWRPYAESERGP